MAYSTGSGNYTALMAAVLAFAIADGWTTSGGNWPISKGVVRGVDWATFTGSEPDWTASGGASIATRYIRIAIGTSLANSTANAAITANSAVLANCHYTFSNWWIFSDSGTGKPNYISVVVQFSNGSNIDCFAHFSFGELEKHGMTHTGTAFVTASTVRAYANGSASGSSAWDHNLGPSGIVYRPFAGSVGIGTSRLLQNNLILIVDPTVNPIPLAGTFQAADTLIPSNKIYDNLKSTISASGNIGLRGDQHSFGISSWLAFTQPQPFSGAISLGPIPVFFLDGASLSALFLMLGSFPNVRYGSILNYSAGDEVTFGAETWKIFPMLRDTANSLLQTPFTITSGRAAFAYKKVV